LTAKHREIRDNPSGLQVHHPYALQNEDEGQ